MAEKTLLLLVAMALIMARVLNLGVATSLLNSHSRPGSLSNVSKDDLHLQQVILMAAQNFNNQSDDMFLFKPSAIRRAQRQIVKGLRYVIDVDISRTVCHKQDANVDLTKCDLQPRGNLHQVVKCHATFWLIPWKNETKTQNCSCKNQENNKQEMK